MSQQEPKRTFEQFAVVELFGHSTIAGLVTEESIGGASFIRIDVPAIDEDHPAFTKYYGGAAIYGISPCSEEIARHVAGRLRARPVQSYMLPEPKPQARTLDSVAKVADVDDYDGDDDNDDDDDDWPDEDEVEPKTQGQGNDNDLSNKVDDDDGIRTDPIPF